MLCYHHIAAPADASTGTRARKPLSASNRRPQASFAWVGMDRVSMILPQVHLRKPCYDFSFL